jgi:hypothetical protein
MMAKMNFTGRLGKNAQGRSSPVKARPDLQPPMHRRKLRSEDSLRPPLSFVKSSDNESAAQESKDPMPPHLSCFEPMQPSRYNHDGARGKFNKRSSASTSSAHPRRHYYGEPSDTIASLAAELAIARAELDAKDSELADMRAALEDKNKDFTNVNKKLCAQAP